MVALYQPTWERDNFFLAFNLLETNGRGLRSLTRLRLLCLRWSIFLTIFHYVLSTFCLCSSIFCVARYFVIGLALSVFDKTIVKMSTGTIPPSDTRRIAIVMFDALLALISILTVGLRLWAKRIQRHQLGLPDYTIILALVGLSTHSN
jgi:hypothetical protein